MPIASPRPCRSPGCAVLVTVRDGYCDQHRKAAHAAIDARRESASKRGYGRKWQEARVAFLSSNPLCKIHGARGEVVAAEVVDHVIPHRGDLKLFWDRKNWQPLCKRCHDTKTATEGVTFGRPPSNPGGGRNFGGLG